MRTTVLGGRRRGKWTRPTRPAHQGPTQGLRHTFSCPALTPTPIHCPGSRNSINRAGAVPASQDRSLVTPQPARSSNNGNVKKSCTQHTSTYGHRHTDTQTHIYTCLHTDATQGPVHTGHTETNLWGVGGSDQPDTCARKENSVSCSSWTYQNL